jgi:hypothetical protein
VFWLKLLFVATMKTNSTLNNVRGQSSFLKSHKLVQIDDDDDDDDDNNNNDDDDQPGDDGQSGGDTANVELLNGWLTSGLELWTEVNKKADGTTAAEATLNLASTYIVDGAPSGAQYVQGRNLYGAAIEVWFTQTVENLPAGSYTFSCQVAGSSQETFAASLIAIESDGTEKSQPISFPGGGWKPSSDNTLSITSPGGNVKFGIYIDAKKGNKIGGSGDPGIKFTNFRLVAGDSTNSDAQIETPPVISPVDEGGYTVYYVDSKTGNNANNGQSESAPFKTLGKIVELVKSGFQPRTKVLLRSGCVFEENLVLKNLNGTAERPFILDRYGNGDRPTISGSGDYAVLIQDDNLRFRNIRITNKSGTRGILVQAQYKGAGVFRNIEITGCLVEAVNWAGNAAFEGVNPASLDVEAIAQGTRFSTKEYGGIILETATTKSQGPCWYENIFITNNTIRQVCRSGILVTGKWGQRDAPGSGLNEYVDDNHRWYPHRNIIIQGNDLSYIGGDGVILMGSTDSYIDHNRCFHANFLGRQGQASAGLWPYSSTNIVMQYNEVACTWLAHGSADGEGLDVDMACKNTLVQYNYVHHNAGGGILLCNTTEGDHTGTIIRNNVFYNNKGSYRGSLMTVSGNVSAVEVYNNIILQTEATTNFLLSDDWPKSGKSKNVRFRNNIFTSTIPISPSFVFNNMENPTFVNNLFHRVGTAYSVDEAPLQYDPKITPPASADGFSKVQQFRPGEVKVFQDGLLFDGMPEKDLAGNPAQGAAYVGAFAK